MRIPVTEAKGQLTELVRRAEAGDEIILTRRGPARSGHRSAGPEGAARLAGSRASKRRGKGNGGTKRCKEPGLPLQR